MPGGDVEALMRAWIDWPYANGQRHGLGKVDAYLDVPGTRVRIALNSDREPEHGRALLTRFMGSPDVTDQARVTWDGRHDPGLARLATLPDGLLSLLARLGAGLRSFQVSPDGASMVLSVPGGSHRIPLPGTSSAMLRQAWTPVPGTVSLSWDGGNRVVSHMSWGDESHRGTRVEARVVPMTGDGMLLTVQESILPDHRVDPVPCLDGDPDLASEARRLALDPGDRPRGHELAVLGWRQVTLSALSHDATVLAVERLVGRGLMHRVGQDHGPRRMAATWAGMRVLAAIRLGRRRPGRTGVVAWLKGPR